MELRISNELTEEQKKQIQNLEVVCYEKESLENHLFLSNELNFDKKIPVFYMAYEGEQLIGFLTLFIPTVEEAEISAIVHPDYQRKGIFTRLVKEARNIIEKNKITSCLYVAETKSKSANKVLERWKISEKVRSEYRMKLNIEKFQQAKRNIKQENISVRNISPENVYIYLDIDSTVFGERRNSEYAETIMTSKLRKGYVFYREGIAIGTVSIGLETEGEAFLYGVAIVEQERGKGYGKLLMEKACEIGLEYGNTIWLDVDSENPVAFQLYQKMGFEITFQVDYYKR